MLTYVLMVAVALIVCYLIGSVNFAVIISKTVAHKDVREHGSGNAGMTNVIRTVGIKPGLITLVGDVLKGVGAVLLTRFLILEPAFAACTENIPAVLEVKYMVYLCAAACMLGHVFPLYFQFRGGKGVSTAIGVLYCINWQAATFVLLTFLVLFLITKIVSIGSVMGAVEWIFYVFLCTAGASLPMRLYETLLGAILAAIVIIRHKDNIIRLRNGEEKAIHSKK